MNQLVRWDPFADLDQVQDRLNRMSRQLFDRGPPDSAPAAAWAPLVDITEDDKAYVFRAELPDMKREDIRVHVENGVLTIEGERKLEKEEKNRRYHRVERSYGTFARSFSLPENTKADGVAAAYRDGILSVSVPKGVESRPRPIEVKAG